jgi:hypothetical protein
MNLPRVLLHLGLPKTATSSLQHNVFQKLHNEDRLNFLGKCLDHDYKTGKLEIFNYTGKFIRDAAEGTLSIEESRQQLVSVVKRDCLNVFSDEGLMVAYPGKKNCPLSEKIENLTKIFEDYDVKVVVTLRDPVDYLYSLYVELYPDYCSKVREINSVQNYVKSLLSNPGDLLFESFFFKKWLPVLEKNFDVTVFKYSQLVSKDPSVYQGWAALLGLTTDEFREYFDSKKVNVKTKLGKEVKKVRNLKGLENQFRKLLSMNRIVFNAAKWIYNVSRLKKVIGYRFLYSGSHSYPEGEQYDSLQELLNSKQ